MQLWLSLFLIFSVIFGALILVWYRTVESRRNQRFAKSLATGMEAELPTVTTTVLVPAPPAKSKGFGNPSARKSTLLSCGSGFAGLLVGLVFRNLLGLAAPLLGAGFGFVIPRMLAARQVKKRLTALEEQLPESLDFLARSIRAGNAFSMGLELLGAEANEPLKSEILKMTRELALGARLEDALQGFVERVPLVEIRFFASAVLLQRETGGNLGEILGKLSISLRERFRLRGHVKAASGQGRLTAMVLTVLPVATLCLLKLSSPDYLNGLVGDPLGRGLLGAAVVSQVLGYLCMKKIINIEV